jgi:hypothetical protein
MPADPSSAKAALDRIVIPQEVLERIAGIAPRSSIIITDEALSSETGKGTEFVVVLSASRRYQVPATRSLGGRIQLRPTRSPALSALACRGSVFDLVNLFFPRPITTPKRLGLAGNDVCLSGQRGHLSRQHPDKSPEAKIYAGLLTVIWKGRIGEKRKSFAIPRDIDGRIGWVRKSSAPKGAKAPVNR